MWYDCGGCLECDHSTQIHDKNISQYYAQISWILQPFLCSFSLFHSIYYIVQFVCANNFIFDVNHSQSHPQTNREIKQAIFRLMYVGLRDHSYSHDGKPYYFVFVFLHVSQLKLLANVATLRVSVVFINKTLSFVPNTLSEIERSDGKRK